MPSTPRARGGNDYARLSLLHPGGTTAHLIPFADLAPSRQLFVTFRARGYSLPRAAEMADVPYTTVTRWSTQPWCRAAIREVQADIVSDKIAALTQVLPSALAALATVLRDGNATERLDAAKYVVDHVYGKATTRTESHSRSEVALVSPDDVLAALDRVQSARVVDADVTPVDAP